MNFQVYNNKIWTFPLRCQNAAAVSQPFPAGSSFAVVSSNPASLTAAATAVTGGYNLVLTPKVQASPGLTVTVTTAGMAPAVFMVDIVADPNLLSVVVDTTAPTTTPLAIPVAPGP